MVPDSRTESLNWIYRYLDDGFILVKAELSVPHVFLARKIPYKYIVFKAKRKDSKEKKKRLWEQLPGLGTMTNRCLHIPQDRRREGGTFMAFSITLIRAYFKRATAHYFAKCVTVILDSQLRRRVREELISTEGVIDSRKEGGGMAFSVPVLCPLSPESNIALGRTIYWNEVTLTCAPKIRANKTG